MGLAVEQRTSLAYEGLTNKADFIDYKEDELKIAFKNMRAGLTGVAGIPSVPKQS